MLTDKTNLELCHGTVILSLKEYEYFKNCKNIVQSIHKKESLKIDCDGYTVISGADAVRTAINEANKARKNSDDLHEELLKSRNDNVITYKGYRLLNRRIESFNKLPWWRKLFIFHI